MLVLLGLGSGERHRGGGTEVCLGKRNHGRLVADRRRRCCPAYNEQYKGKLLLYSAASGVELKTCGG